MNSLKLKDLTFSDQLGRGGFGAVSKAFKKDDGTAFAVKTCQVQKDNTESEVYVMREIEVLKLLSPHPNIVKILGFEKY